MEVVWGGGASRPPFTLPLLPPLTGQCLCSERLFLWWGVWEAAGGVGDETRLCGLWSAVATIYWPCATGTGKTPGTRISLNLSEADGRTAGRLRRGRRRRVVFDKGDGCQLFAELLQHDHALQQSHVIDATTEANSQRWWLPSKHHKRKWEWRTTRKFLPDALRL